MVFYRRWMWVGEEVVVVWWFISISRNGRNEVIPDPIPHDPHTIPLPSSLFRSAHSHLLPQNQQSQNPNSPPPPPHPAHPLYDSNNFVTTTMTGMTTAALTTTSVRNPIIDTPITYPIKSIRTGMYLFTLALSCLSFSSRVRSGFAGALGRVAGVVCVPRFCVLRGGGWAEELWRAGRWGVVHCCLFKAGLLAFESLEVVNFGGRAGGAVLFIHF